MTTNPIILMWGEKVAPREATSLNQYASVQRWRMENEYQTVFSCVSQVPYRTLGQYTSGPRNGQWIGLETPEGQDQYPRDVAALREDPNSCLPILPDGRQLAMSNMNETDAVDLVSSTESRYGGPTLGVETWRITWADPSIIAPVYLLASIRGAYSSNAQVSWDKIEWMLTQNPRFLEVVAECPYLHCSLYDWGDGNEMAQRNFVRANLELFRELDPLHEKLWVCSTWNRLNSPHRFLFSVEEQWSVTYRECLGQGRLGEPADDASCDGDGFDVHAHWGAWRLEYYTRGTAENPVNEDWWNVVMPQESAAYTEATTLPVTTRDDYVIKVGAVETNRWLAVSGLYVDWRESNGFESGLPERPDPDSPETPETPPEQECDCAALEATIEQQKIDYNYLLNASQVTVATLNEIIADREDRLDDILPRADYKGECAPPPPSPSPAPVSPPPSPSPSPSPSPKPD